EAVLEKQPSHPYASDLAADCHILLGEGARARGEDPEPHLRKALSLLQPTLKRYPQFLWGMNDLGQVYDSLGVRLQLHGEAAAKEMLQSALEYFNKAASLDPTYLYGAQNSMASLSSLILEAKSDGELQGMLSRADDWFARCKAINSRFPQCFNNYFQ